MTRSCTEGNAIREAALRVMECVRNAEEAGHDLHALGRADGDYHTYDHDRAAEILHFATKEREQAMREFFKVYGAKLIGLLGKKRK